MHSAEVWQIFWVVVAGVVVALLIGFTERCAEEASRDSMRRVRTDTYQEYHECRKLFGLED